MSVLTSAQQRELRARAHAMKPVVTVAGKGLSESVLKEIDRSLQAHELIKVKLQGMERDARAELMHELCARLDAAAVQHIGNTLVIWRARVDNADSQDSSPQARSASKPNPATAKSAAALAAAARRAALARANAGRR